MKEGLPYHSENRLASTSHETVVFPKEGKLLKKNPATVERQWLRTIHFSSFEEAKRYALLSTGSSMKELTQAVSVSKKVAESKSNQRSLAVTNRIIEAASINPNGKAAQLFRLKGQRINPMDADQFSMSTIGRDIHYLRTLRGATQKDVEKAIKRDIGGIESNVKNSSENFENAFFDWLEIPKDHVIARIMRIKRKGLIPTERIYELSKELKAQQYLFQEHLVYIKPERISEEDKSVLKDIQSRELSTSQIIRMLRNKKDLSREDIAERTGISPVSIKSIEDGKRSPWPQRAVLLAGALGYDIHHAFTKELLRISEEEIKQKRKPQQF